MKFLMMTKLIDRYEWRLNEFIEMIKEYVERGEWAFEGITEISRQGVSYNTSLTTGAKGCYETRYNRDYADWFDIIEYFQNKGETK
jgi:hypothetical protein